MRGLPQKLELNVLISVMMVLILAQADADSYAAVRAHMYCVRDYVFKLDDHRISPQELAKKIQPLCHGLHEVAMKGEDGWSVTSEKNRNDVEFMHTWAAVLWARHLEDTSQ
jgi:hypothetical protein